MRRREFIALDWRRGGRVAARGARAATRKIAHNWIFRWSFGFSHLKRQRGGACLLQLAKELEQITPLLADYGA